MNICSLKWWVKDPDDGIDFKLNDLNLAHPYFERPTSAGVYIIWYLDNGNGVTVYAGQGTIKDRFYAHRRDKRIRNYASKTLFVAWAEVPKDRRDRIEAFLHNELQPKVLGSSPKVTPQRVNLPWD